MDQSKIINFDTVTTACSVFPLYFDFFFPFLKHQSKEGSYFTRKCNFKCPCIWQVCFQTDVGVVSLKEEKKTLKNSHFLTSWFIHQLVLWHFLLINRVVNRKSSKRDKLSKKKKIRWEINVWYLITTVVQWAYVLCHISSKISTSLYPWRSDLQKEQLAF